MDAVALGEGEGIVPSDARIVEFSLTELDRLLSVLGGDGMVAFVAYLKVLRRERLADGSLVLLVDNYSAAWLMATTSLGKTAAYRAQGALDTSGLMHAVTTGTGVGARGKQRGVLNTNLVLIVGGGVGDTDSLPRRRRPNFGKAEGRDVTPSSHFPEVRELGPFSRTSPFPENGTTAPADCDVSTVLPGSGITEMGRALGSKSSESSFSLHLSDSAGAGTLHTVLAPAFVTAPELTRRRVGELFNDATIAERAGTLLELLALRCAPHERGRALSGLVELVVTGEQDPVELLDRIGVARKSLTGLSRQVATDRFIWGLVVGLGMSQVKSWGAWMFRVCDPQWVPRRNAFSDQFTTLLTALPTPTIGDGATAPGSTAPENTGPASITTVPAVLAKPSAGLGAATAAPSPALDRAVVEELLPTARTAFPQAATLTRFQGVIGEARLVQMLLQDTG